MLIDTPQIKKIIPQREPFIMIDQLVSANEEGFLTHFVIKESNVFFSKGDVSSSAIIENIAQTCAAGFGYLGSLSGEQEARIGFIGAISKLQITGRAQLHDQITTKVVILNSFENIHLVEGTASVGEQPIVSCQLKIVQV